MRLATAWCRAGEARADCGLHSQRHRFFSSSSAYLHQHSLQLRYSPDPSFDTALSTSHDLLYAPCKAGDSVLCRLQEAAQ